MTKSEWDEIYRDVREHHGDESCFPRAIRRAVWYAFSRSHLGRDGVTPRSERLRDLSNQQWERNDDLLRLQMELEKTGVWRSPGSIAACARKVAESQEQLRERLYRHSQWRSQCRHATLAAKYCEPAGRRGER